MSNASGISIDEDIQRLGYGRHVVSSTPGPSVTNEEETVSVPWQCIKGGRPLSGMTLQRKMVPKMSGGTIADVLSNEFRVLVSSIISPAQASICFVRGGRGDRLVEDGDRRAEL